MALAQRLALLQAGVALPLPPCGAASVPLWPRASEDPVSPAARPPPPCRPGTRTEVCSPCFKLYTRPLAASLLLCLPRAPAAVPTPRRRKLRFGAWDSVGHGGGARQSQASRPWHLTVAQRPPTGFAICPSESLCQGDTAGLAGSEPPRRVHTEPPIPQAAGFSSGFSS